MSVVKVYFFKEVQGVTALPALEFVTVNVILHSLYRIHKL